MEENSVMSSMAATNPRWLAPEILAGANASFASGGWGGWVGKRAGRWC